MSFHFFTFVADMKEMKVTIHSIDELDGLATRLLNFAGENKLIALSGAMGSGKTTFIKAICKQLGVRDSMNSPTFSLMNEYIGKGENPIYHFDFYRIKNEREAIDIGCEEYFYSGHYCFVEWSEKIINLLPKEMVRVLIEVLAIQDETRLITFHYE